MRISDWSSDVCSSDLDWQLGALSGISFALLYSVAALPIARLADRSNRVRIIGTAVIVWSFFTAASAGAANFVQLLLLRIGVGVGEAGGGPPSQALIADSFPPERRSAIGRAPCRERGCQYV